MKDIDLRRDLSYGDAIRKQILHQSLQNERDSKLAKALTFHPVINNNPDYADVKPKLHLPTLLEDAKKELERRQNLHLASIEARESKELAECTHRP